MHKYSGDCLVGINCTMRIQWLTLSPPPSSLSSSLSLCPSPPLRCRSQKMSLLVSIDSHPIAVGGLLAVKDKKDSITLSSGLSFSSSLCRCAYYISLFGRSHKGCAYVCVCLCVCVYTHVILVTVSFPHPQRYFCTCTLLVVSLHIHAYTSMTYIHYMCICCPTALWCHTYVGRAKYFSKEYIRHSQKSQE